MSKSLNLFWYNPRKINPFRFWRNYKKPKLNFGDELSALIVQHLSGRKIVHSSHQRKGKIVALGSVMHYAEDGDYIWGTGINGNYTDLKPNVQDLNIFAVRGHKTRDLLLQKGFDCPEVYGDPGLLTHLLFDAEELIPKTDYIVIPHYRDFDEVPVSFNQNVVSPLQMPLPVLEQIRNTKLVLSSSLHGVICAESMGIPARLIRFTESEHLFKYEDYYASTGRPDFKYATSIEMGLEMGGERSIVFDEQPLMEAFAQMIKATES